MQDTNLEQTSSELGAISDTSFFDVKWRVMEKISGMLGHLQEKIDGQKEIYLNSLPAGIMDVQGKISRGENYMGYPYLVMDYPRIFEKENVFAFRCMFWWGKHFSYTLHAGGIYYEMAKDNFIKNFNLLKQEGIYICIHTDPWEYHFDDHNYRTPENINAEALIEQKTFDQEFIKISLRCELSQWQHITADGLRAFELFTGVLFSG
jgi:hypothetical protein